MKQLPSEIWHLLWRLKSGKSPEGALNELTAEVTATILGLGYCLTPPLLASVAAEVMAKFIRTAEWSQPESELRQMLEELVHEALGGRHPMLSRLDAILGEADATLIRLQLGGAEITQIAKSTGLTVRQAKSQLRRAWMRLHAWGVAER